MIAILQLIVEIQLIERKECMVSSIQGINSMMGGGMMQKASELTDDQKKMIEEILSQYDPENVSEDDAKAIFQAFKDAGIPPAKGMKEAIEAAGFDAEELRSMGMPGQMPPPPPPPSSKSNGVDSSALQSLQELLSQYDLSNLSDTDKSSISSALQALGFMYPGSVVDTTS